MTALKCHFDADGWLQGPIAVTHLTALTPNRYNSGVADKARGLAQHTEDGFEAGTVATFLNPASQASAWVRKSSWNSRGDRYSTKLARGAPGSALGWG